MVLDRAFTDESALRAHPEGLLGARVHRLTVQRVDMVNDTTPADVRYELTTQPLETSTTGARPLVGVRR